MITIFEWDVVFLHADSKIGCNINRIVQLYYSKSMANSDLNRTTTEASIGCSSDPIEPSDEMETSTTGDVYDEQIDGMKEANDTELNRESAVVRRQTATATTKPKKKIHVMMRTAKRRRKRPLAAVIQTGHKVPSTQKVSGTVAVAIRGAVRNGAAANRLSEVSAAVTGGRRKQKQESTFAEEQPTLLAPATTTPIKSSNGQLFTVNH